MAEEKKEETLENENITTEEKEETAENTASNDSESNEEEKKELISEEEKLKLEVEELKDKHLRLYSEFENFRRRTIKEKADIIATASKDIVGELLPVLDDIERAESSFENAEDAKALKEGVDLIFNKFRKVLENKGLKPFESVKGKDFDPEIHEAITQIPAPEESLKGKVVDEIEKGYYLNDKIIRYSKVVIGQ